MAKNVKLTKKPQNALLHSNYVFMPIWVEIAQNSTKTFKNGQIRSKTSKWLKNLKMVYCTQITFLCPFELQLLKTQLKRLKMIENVKITWKPENCLLHSNYVSMPICVEIAQNSNKTTQNCQIWQKMSKWPKNLKMVYCTQSTFLCPFVSKSLKFQLIRLKMVK